METCTTTKEENINSNDNDDDMNKKNISVSPEFEAFCDNVFSLMKAGMAIDIMVKFARITEEGSFDIHKKMFLTKFNSQALPNHSKQPLGNKYCMPMPREHISFTFASDDPKSSRAVFCAKNVQLL